MRLKICKKCGKMFRTETGHSDKYLCQECYAQSKKEGVYRERICKICGTHFMGYPRSFFCPTCSTERKKNQKKIYNRRQPSRTLGSIDVCKNCGKEYIVNSGRQKYCPNCADNAIKNNVSNHKKQYNSTNKEHIQEYKKSMRTDSKVCVICGKIIQSPTSTVVCSEECKKELIRHQRNKSDIKRGRRKLPSEERYKSNRPQSGVKGVTWRDNGKWQAVYNRNYIGVFNTIDEASRAIEDYKK